MYKIEIGVLEREYQLLFHNFIFGVRRYYLTLSTGSKVENQIF